MFPKERNILPIEWNLIFLGHFSGKERSVKRVKQNQIAFAWSKRDFRPEPVEPVEPVEKIFRENANDLFIIMKGH
ncbi:hypothetical protein ZMO01_03740 [Zymomonas mobilis subsp. mobilis]|nr:hypothetical protein ZMO01_03740 [Zymomonas mobilis subsp. mobilis]